MNRTKVFAVLLALLAATAAAVALAGNASAAQWHAYEGDVFPGHAYAIQVPPGADALEVLFEGTGDAAVSLYDPAGARVGFYRLESGLSSAIVEKPDAGRHVVYVHELAEGALTVRVNAEQAGDLELRTLRLAREDVPLESLDKPAALDKTATVTLKGEPVFVTLLYEGSVADLDATIASEAGEAVTITDETGTAMAPGVWSSLTGTRASEPANLVGTTYTVELAAEKAEGRFMLSALRLDLQAAPQPLAAPKAPKAPDAPAPFKVADPARGHAFVLEAETAQAFHAEAGTLLLRMLPQEEDHDWDCPEGAVSVYDPQDRLVAFVPLTDNETAEVELPVAGEYVAYVHWTWHGDVVGMLPDATQAPALRELPLQEEAFAFAFDDGSGEAAFELARAPVAMTLRLEEDSVGVLSRARVVHDDGVVASVDAPAHAPFASFVTWSWTDPELFRAGEHVLEARGLFAGELELTSVSYVREPVEPAPAAAADDAEAEEEAPEEDEESWFDEVWGLIPL